MTVAPDQPAATPASRRLPIACVAALVALTLALGATSIDRITTPFGNSDEGLNSSVWAMCTRALRDDPIGSALGGRRPDGVEYANHPPLTCVAGAAAEAAVGEHPWSTRAPAWLASLALIPLVALALRRLGLDAWAATAATVAALGTPMLATYGPMLDTPVVGLPVGAAVLAVWARERPADGDGRPARTTAVVGLALLAGLASWQVGWMTLLAGAALVAWGPDRRRAVPWIVGAAAGLALSMGWALWVYGSLDTLVDKLGSRSGGSHSLGDSLDFQVTWLRELLGVVVIGLAGCVAALADRRLRPAAAVLLATLLTWMLVLHGGAGGHQYWNVYAVLPAALGWGHLVDLVRRRAAGRRARERAGVVALAVSAALAAVALSGTGLAERLIDEGAPAGEALAAHRDAVGPGDPATDELAVVGDAVRTYAIVVYHAGARPEALHSVDEVRALVASDPATPVFVARPCLQGGDRASWRLCTTLPGARGDASEVTTAAAVLEELGG